MAQINLTKQTATTKTGPNRLGLFFDNENNLKKVDENNVITPITGGIGEDIFKFGQVIPIKETKTAHCGLMSGLFMSATSNKWVCWWREGDTHGTDTSSVVKAKDSYDGGLTWENERTIHSETSIDTRNGASIVMNGNRFGLLMNRYNGSFLAPVFIYSDNEGVTWSNSILSTMPNGGPMKLINYPTSVGGSDAQGFIGFYDDKTTNDIVAIYTKNNGSTWASQTVLSKSVGLGGDYCVEPDVVRLGNENKWIMIFRNQGTNNNTDNLNSRISKSTDLFTWSNTILSGQEQGRNTGTLFYDNNLLYYITTSRFSTSTNIEIIDDTYRNKMLYQFKYSEEIWNDLTAWNGWKVMFSHSNDNSDELLLEPPVILIKHGEKIYGTFASKENNTSKNYASIYLFTNEIYKNNLSGFAKRGDPSAYDYTSSTLTLDGNVHSLDLSSLVPNWATVIILTCQFSASTVGAFIRFYDNANTNQYASSTIFSQVSGVVTAQTLFVFCTNSIIKYRAFLNSGSISACNVVITGYM